MDRLLQLQRELIQARTTAQNIGAYLVSAIIDEAIEETQNRIAEAETGFADRAEGKE